MRVPRFRQLSSLRNSAASSKSQTKPSGGLEFMHEAGIASDEVLLAEAKELLAIFAACLISARRNIHSRAKG